MKLRVDAFALNPEKVLAESVANPNAGEKTVRYADLAYPICLSKEFQVRVLTRLKESCPELKKAPPSWPKLRGVLNNQIISCIREELAPFGIKITDPMVQTCLIQSTLLSAPFRRLMKKMNSAMHKVQKK